MFVYKRFVFFGQNTASLRRDSVVKYIIKIIEQLKQQSFYLKNNLFFYKSCVVHGVISLNNEEVDSFAPSADIQHG